MTNFTIGSLVTNFGVIAEILEIDPLRGILLREVSTLANRSCGKWYANPEYCEPYGKQYTVRQDGLVAIG